MSKGSVAVQIAGHEYRIRSDADAAWLQKVAGHVDETMQRVRERTGTIDTFDVAVLTALNLARELITLRQTSPVAGDARLRELIELAESAVAEPEEPAPGVS